MEVLTTTKVIPNLGEESSQKPHSREPLSYFSVRGRHGASVPFPVLLSRERLKSFPGKRSPMALSMYLSQLALSPAIR